MPCDLSMCYIGASCGYCLEPVEAADCPADVGPHFVHCEDPSLRDGDLCEGDGECGTSTTLDNCGDGFEVYRKRCDATRPELAYATGSDDRGRLGYGMGRSDTDTPVRIMSTVALVDVAAGFRHSLFVAADGQAYGAGRNGYGCLGDGNAWNDEYIPVPVMQGYSVSRVAASNSNYFSLFLTAEGRVYGAGWNDYGNLGTGSSSHSYGGTLTRLLNVTAISAGGEHSLFLTAGLEAYATGRNHLGQLGDGTEVTRYSPVHVMRNHSVTHVAAGGAHSLFVTSEGAAYGAGLNDYGQLGDGTETSKYEPVRVMSTHSVSRVAAGDRHSLFLTAAGQPYACGENSHGQLGDGTLTKRMSPVAVVVSEYVVTQEVSAGYRHSMFVTSAGVTYACGLNGNGQLGDGSRSHRLTPVEVMGSTYRVRVVSAGRSHSLFAGDPFEGQPEGEPSATGSSSPPTLVPTTAPTTLTPSIDQECSVNASLQPVYGSTVTHTAMDDDEAVILTGYFSSQNTFGARVLTSSGGTDVFITKVAANGTSLWAIQAKGTSDDYGSSVSVGRTGSIVVSGSFSSTSITFGTHVLANTQGNGHFDMFVTKVNGQGTFLWVRRP